MEKHIVGIDLLCLVYTFIDFHSLHQYIRSVLNKYPYALLTLYFVIVYTAV